MSRTDLWSGLAIVAGALLSLLWLLPTYGGQSFGRGRAAQFMPSIGAWAMLVCGGLLVAQSLRRMRRAGTEAPLPAPDTRGLWRRLLFTLWPLAYVAAAILAIVNIGLISSGPVIIALLLVLIGERRAPVVLAAALIPPAIIYVLAVHLMRIGVI